MSGSSSLRGYDSLTFGNYLFCRGFGTNTVAVEIATHGVTNRFSSKGYKIISLHRVPERQYRQSICVLRFSESS